MPNASRESDARYKRQATASVRDIGTPPPITHPGRRESTRRDFRAFCETYFAAQFTLAWSEDHLLVIRKIETVVLSGGQFAIAMPRGSGKTTLCEIAITWAMLHAHRRFTVLVGADGKAATQMLESIKVHIATNELLLADFPEVCYPIVALDGINQRAAGQTSNGELTRIRWTDEEIVLPTIKGSASSGAIVRVAGITGRIRGLKQTLPDGSSARPDLVLIDDPQTDESAKSPSQCADRLRIIKSAILGLAGPGKKIAALMPVTVVHQGDLADTVLDRNLCPNWQGERTKLMKSMPTDTAKWNEYAEIWRACKREGTSIEAATAFYLTNREAMDAGAVASWPARYEEDEASAIQHAMNLKIRDEASFWAEYQNEPIKTDGHATPAIDGKTLSVDARLSHLERHIAPIEATKITGFIDVQGEALFYVVLAVRDDFTAWVIDYGVEPEQTPSKASQLELTLSMMPYSDGSLESRVYGGLRSLIDRLGSREWRTVNGDAMRISRAMVDAQWGDSTDTVYRALRESGRSDVFVPSHGKYIGASSVPMHLWTKKPGDRVGLNWKMTRTDKRALKHVVYDTNWWKTFAVNRLRVSPGSRGAVSFFGDRITQHELLIDHLTSEYPIQTEGRGRRVDEWKLRTGMDNHWWDCFVGALVAASEQGCTLDLGEAAAGASVKVRKKIRMSEILGGRQ